MEKVPIKKFQNNFDEYIKKVESGQTFMIENSDGRSVVMMPIDDDLIKIHTDHNDGC
jgi:prevent-host-death family protein